MNPKTYAEQVVSAEPASPTPWLNAKDLYAVVVRSGYPVPEHGGVEIFYGPKEKANGAVDWPVSHLRRLLAETIEHVAEDCISVLQSLDLDETAKQNAAKAIRAHFGIEVH